MSIEVLRPGMLSTVQDLGRAGYAALGVGRSGALDTDALRLGNALLGNAATAAGLEITLHGPTLRFNTRGAFALCGADFIARLDGQTVSGWSAMAAEAGSVLELGHARSGCRAWLALAGGIDSPTVLGSRSTDLNAGLGPLPQALRRGDVLTLGAQASTPRAPSTRWSLDPRPWFALTEHAPLRLLPGRDYAHLDQSSVTALCNLEFRVAAASNRVGVRLNGATLRLTHALECVSEGCVPGVVQLPPSGQPIVLLGEHPVSGGYPRIAQIAAVDLPRLAQASPGSALRFVLIDLDTATRALLARQRARADLESRIHSRLAAT